MCSDGVLFFLNDIYPNTGLTSLHLLSWDHNGQERPVVSVETTMVTKVMTSCLALAWLRLVLRLLASPGGSMVTVTLATTMRMIHVLSTLKEVKHTYDHLGQTGK